MPEARLQIVTKTQIKALTESEPKHVKVVVFDDQNRVLTIKSGNYFVLPGGRVEWDDDDAEAAARREVFESANIALGLVRPVTVIKTKNRDPNAQTIIFASRIAGEGTAWPEQRQAHRFMSKETFFRTSGLQSDVVRSLVEAAHRILITEEIKDEYAETAQTGREKYNLCSLL
ncbi:MAG: NUDIX domain-containing protein [Alphaproteobacteria bacterium]|nr:NUDIX domain-containing protein [Alphaproteobacteria bacterium]